MALGLSSYHMEDTMQSAKDRAVNQTSVSAFVRLLVNQCYI